MNCILSTQKDAASNLGRFSVPDLIASIETYLAANNENPKPYMWTATAEDILAKVQRARAPLNNGSLKLRRTTSWLSHFRLQQLPASGPEY